MSIYFTIQYSVYKHTLVAQQTNMALSFCVGEFLLENTLKPFFLDLSPWKLSLTFCYATAYFSVPGLCQDYFNLLLFHWVLVPVFKPLSWLPRLSQSSICFLGESMTEGPVLFSFFLFSVRLLPSQSSSIPYTTFCTANFNTQILKIGK